MRLFLIFQTMGRQLRPILGTNWCCCYFVTVFKMTIAVATGHYLTEWKISIYIKQFSGDIQEREKKSMWQLLFLEIKLTFWMKAILTS